MAQLGLDELVTGIVVVASRPDTLALVASLTNFALLVGVLWIWWMPVAALRR